MSPAKDGPRDWDKELAEVDKLIAGLDAGKGAAGPAAPARQGPGASEKLAHDRAGEARRMTVKTWLLFSLAVLLGGALTWLWPYGRGCGTVLYAFLASTAMFGFMSIWSGIQSWRTRSAVVHSLSVALLFWASFLGAREVLPRVGYAKQAASWRCPARAASPPSPAPAVAPAPASAAQPDSATGTTARPDSAAARPAGADTAKALRRTP